MIRKEQLRIATLGTVVGLFPFVWLSIIPLVATGNHIIEAETTVLGLALIPLSFGYSILRYQLLGISRLVHRSATYVIITAVIIAIYGTVLTVLDLFSDDTDLLRNIELVLLIAMFAGVPLISGVRNRALRVADRLLYPQSLDRESVLEILSNGFSNAQGPTNFLERSVAAIGRGFGLRYAIVSAASAGSDSHTEYGIRPTGFWHEDVTRNLDTQSGVQRVPHGESGTEYLVGSTHGIDGETSKWILGPRIDGAPFDGEDIRLFQLATNMISTELARSELSNAVKKPTARACIV